MKKALIIVSLLAVVKFSFSQDVKTVTFDELQNVLAEKPGTAKLINFWATWCKPCIDEMPSLMKAYQEYGKDHQMEFVLVSVDFQSQHEKVVEKAGQLQLKGTLLHMNAPGNDWIDKVDEEWSGAIPYTILILSDGRKVSHYDQFDSYESLKAFLDKNLSN